MDKKKMLGLALVGGTIFMLINNSDANSELYGGGVGTAPSFKAQAVPPSNPPAPTYMFGAPNFPKPADTSLFFADNNPLPTKKENQIQSGSRSTGTSVANVFLNPQSKFLSSIGKKEAKKAQANIQNWANIKSGSAFNQGVSSLSNPTPSAYNIPKGWA